jgi:flavodoxin
MKTCVLYYSKTGNTKRLAEAIASAINVQAFDMVSSEPAIVENYDLLIMGTPVEKFRPAEEAMTFVERLPKAEGKKTILFCTYALYKGSIFKSLEKELTAKGYNNIYNVAKKGMRPNKPADFTDIINEVKKALPE